MTGTDKILALLAMTVFAIFTGIVIWWVREPDLIIIVVAVVAMAAYDFWKGAGQSKDNP